MHYVCTEKNTFELFFFNKHIFWGFTNKTKRHVYLFYTFFFSFIQNKLSCSFQKVLIYK